MGNPTYPKDQPIADADGLLHYVTPQGLVVRARPEQDEVLQAQGYRLASGQDVQQAVEREQNSGFVPMVGAGLAGIARGVTLGGSDVVARALGAGDDLDKLRRYNPWASGIGEAAGNVAGAAVGGPVKWAEGAGRLAEGAAAKVAGRGLLSATARAATEGMVVATGHAFGEAALGGDYDRLGELLASEIGLGALMGGGAGLGLALAERGLTATTGFARRNMARALSEPEPSSIQRIAEGAFGESTEDVGHALASATKRPWYARPAAKLVGGVSGESRDIMEEALSSATKRRYMTAGADLLDEESAALTRHLSDLKRTVEHTDEAFMGPMKRNEILAALDDANHAAAADKAMQALDDFGVSLKRVGGKTGENFSDEGIKYSKLVKQYDRAVESVRGGIAVGTKEGLADAFMAIDDLKRAAGKRASRLGKRGGAGLRGLDPAERATRAEFIDAYASMRRQLEDDVWGGAAIKQREINEPWHNMLREQAEAGAHSFDSAFTELRTVGEFGLKGSVVDPEKVRLWLHGLVKPDASEKLAAVMRYVNRAEEFVAAGNKHLALTPARRAGTEKIAQKAATIKGRLAYAKDVALSKAQYDAMTGAGMGMAWRSMVGGIVGGAPGAVVGAMADYASNPTKLIKQLAAIDKITGAGARESEKAIGTLAGRAASVPMRTVEVAEKAAGRAYVGALASKARAEISFYSHQKERANRVEFERRKATINAIASSSKTPQEIAAAALHDIAPAAPNVVAAASLSLKNTIAYLSDILPKLGMQNPSPPPPTPSVAEQKRMNQRARAAEEPSALLTKVANGSATPWDIEAAMRVAPALYRGMQQQVFAMMTDVASDGKQLGLRDRMRLDLAFSTGTEPILMPELMQQMQHAFAPQPATPEKPQPPSDAQTQKLVQTSQTRSEALATP